MNITDREIALRDALQNNENEFQRWETYLKDNETAIENMSRFRKLITVDVMVPVGKKAFMPGCLLHTNEVLVSHYQGYFSKCTTFKATEICELRIKMAKERLKNLQMEADLFQNKLDIPYTMGAMPSGEANEIIEEFDEENEKLWKEKHRVSVKLAKEKEKQERIAHLKEETMSRKDTNKEIFEMLEEAELMEELQQEINNMELDEVNDETIRKLMTGEIKLPQEKRRIPHNKTAEKENIDEFPLLSNIVKKCDLKNEQRKNTNNNIQPNPEIMSCVNANIEEEELEELPHEVAIIKEQAKFLSPEDRIGFYEYQIEIIRQKLQLLPLRKQQELDEKIRLLSILEHLDELLDESEEIVGTTELSVEDEEVENAKIVFGADKMQNSEQELISEKNSTIKSFKSNKKPRISFALEDETVEFNKHETVQQMLSPKVEEVQRDIIQLDNTKQENICKHTSDNSINKLDIIQAKVQKNLQYVAENQSKKDFDLVQQIIQSALGENDTLYINFKHSQQEYHPIESKESSNIPGSPADIYKSYIKTQKKLENAANHSTVFINSYEGEAEVKVPTLKEGDRQAVFVNPKSEFSNPLQSKSILKNKSAVDEEHHHDETPKNRSRKNKKPKKNSNEEENNCLSAYYKVMNDVVERHLTEPEPLPDEKFIDVHTPKKRVSRFKQMRQGISS